ncbi:hypothetical protein ANRL4_00014 [Anaerolineae bacterium]|nr:hypothetical protein ANRL4_00014 [Anaerolineae bacterium]
MFTGIRKFIGTTAALALVFSLSLGLLTAPTMTTSAQGDPEAQFPLLREAVEAVVRAVTEATGMTEGDLLREVLSGKTLQVIVTEKGADVEAVQADVKAALTESINKALSEGKLTQDQASKLLESLDNLVERAFSRDGLTMISRVRQGLVNLAKQVLDAAAQALNITPEDLTKELTSGKTLMQVITEKGSTVEAIKAAVKTTVTDAINKTVTEGKMAQEAANRLLEGLDKAIDGLFNRVIENAGKSRQMRLTEARTVGILIAETARATELTQRELLKSLREGKTLSGIATEKGVDPVTIVAASATAFKNQIDRLVKAGRLQQTEADALLNGLNEKLTQMMNQADLLKGELRK